MKKHSVITYRLHKNVKPSEVLAAMEAIGAKHSLGYAECLFAIKVLVLEYEFEGNLHSNREKNAINTILKRYPMLEPFYRRVGDHLSIGNFTEADFSFMGEIDHGIIGEIVNKVPRPYSVNTLHLIYSGVSWDGNRDVVKIDYACGEDSHPTGNYVWYERSSYGYEKHSYVYFAADDNKTESMRQLFLDFAELIPGQYEGTEMC